MQPTAQAVGKQQKEDKPQRGERKNTGGEIKIPTRRKKKRQGWGTPGSQLPNYQITKLPNFKMISVPVVIAIVPVVFFTPAALVLIPPAMMFAPAAFTRRVQFAALVLGLPAVAAVPLDGFMQFMIPMSNAPLASLHTLSLRARPSHEQQNSHPCRQRHE